MRTLGSDNWITRVNVSMHAGHDCGMVPSLPTGILEACACTLGSDNWITLVNVSMHARHELVAFWYGTHPTGHWVYIGLPLLDYVVKFLLTH